jgi:hypothetical protein
MPIWLTLIVGAFAAWGTYMLAPKITAAIEVQKGQSQYIYDNLKMLNQDTAEILSIVGDAIETISDGEPIKPDQFSNIRRIVHRLQWRANEYEALFRGEKSSKTIKNYSKSINDLQYATVIASRDGDVSILISAAEIFAGRSRDLVRFLSDRADWSSSFSRP